MKCVNGSEEEASFDRNESCDWEGPMGTLGAHLDLCEFLPVPCPRKCNEKPMRKNLTEHLTKYCHYRAWECELCKEPGLYSFAASHLKVCPVSVIKCPSVGCPEEVQRRHIAKHLLTCDHDLVHCKYSSIGCDARLKRVDIPKHNEENEGSHLCLAMNKVAELKDYNERLEGANLPLVRAVTHLDEKYNAIIKSYTEIAEATGTDMRALEDFISMGNQGLSALAMQIKTMVFAVHQAYTFKMTDCQSYFESERIFTSNPFYTVPDHRSYHMVVKVHLKGGANPTCASVHAALVDGKFDQDLSWPFVGEIGLLLLNQLGNYHHCYKIMCITASDNMRVGSLPQGSADFITHKDLFRTPDAQPVVEGAVSMDASANPDPTAVQYLKDDTLYFKVMINQLKSWLSCSE